MKIMDTINTGAGDDTVASVVGLTGIENLPTSTNKFLNQLRSKPPANPI
jgi:hypothetical protein